MKKILVCLFMLVLVACCNKANAAVIINTDGLSEAQKAELVQQAERMKETKGDITTTSVEKWTNFAEVFGRTIANTAKEVGVQVNEFVKTPVGKMTAAIIIYRYAGKDIIQAALYIFAGITCLIIGGLWANRVANSGKSVTITYDLTTKNIFGNHPVKSKEVSKVDSDYLISASLIKGISVAIFIVFIANSF